MRTGLVLLLALLAGGCTTVQQQHQTRVIPVDIVSTLPVPATNNSVVVWSTAGETPQLQSFYGLGAGKSETDVLRIAQPQRTSVRSLLPMGPPVSQGRLAAAAARVGHHAYLMGGYTVAEDGTEVSTPEVFRITPSEGLNQYERRSDIPVPSDDALLVTYQDRYLYLISGWHDLGNINLVQLYDTETDEWTQATPYPGTPVFGHGGGAVGNQMIVCDGVRIRYRNDGPREFLPENACWQGRIDADDRRRIHWQPAPDMPGPGRYRAAAGPHQGRVFFVGGSANPYNYNGIGYNGVPSEPLDAVVSFDFESGQWFCHGRLDVATMDHRNLPSDGERLYLAGGMRSGQVVTDEVLGFSPGDGKPCGRFGPDRRQGPALQGE